MLKKLSIKNFLLIQFLFSANRGVEMQSLEKTASGGELSRVMLAIKCLIADKDHAQCLIFDEIDANVGGKSASIIGEKLLALSKYRQVICVTHFVQVAKKAQTHFLVEKKHQTDINSCTVQKLSFEAKKLEFQRMIGHDPLWIKESQTIR